MRRWQRWTGERRLAKAVALPALLLVTLAGNAGPQATPPAGPDQASESFRISVDVALVVLHATVTNRQGGFVSNLGERDFTVYENGVPQSIRLFRNEDMPVTVGLVIDHSTTMLPKLAEISAATRTFVRSSNPDDEMFVVNFNEIVSMGLRGTTRFTNNAAELQGAIATPAGGQTALYDATARAIEELRAGSRDRKALIVLSDGGDNASARSLSDVMKMAGQSNAVIYTVGLFDEADPDRNPRVLSRLARETGGEAFFPNQANEVVAICERIARDIRHQYTVGYVPASPARDGAYRAIQVNARAKSGEKLTVRARAGYIAGGEPPVEEKGAK